MQKQLSRSITSLAITFASLLLAYVPLPGLTQKIVVVSGTELQEPLAKLAADFAQAHPDIQVELKFQGSQELANKYLNEQNDFQPTILIPANGEILQELADRLRTQDGGEPFYGAPQPLAKTLLVGIAWSDRGQVLFPTGNFDWQQVIKAMEGKSWGAIGGNPAWGSFDLVITDPTRSNSGQLTLGLLIQANSGNLDPAILNSPATQSLLGLVKRSVYQPPRSTDTLLQEFITRGANDADVTTIYESVALYRWSQSTATQGKPYQIYYLNPTVETKPTAAIVRRQVDSNTATAAQKFLDFLQARPQQIIFAQYGLRPIIEGIDLQSIPNSPWTENIPGIQINPSSQILPSPNPQTLQEIQRLWERSN